MSYTVNELLEQLQKVKDKTLPVQTEGCDCYGEANEVLVEDDRVLLKR
jgi:hypothetical protein